MDPSGSNTRFCPDSVSITLGQKGTCWCFIQPKLLKYETYRTEVLKVVFLVRQNQRVEWSKAVLDVEVSPMGSKPPVAVGERFSKGERHVLGAAALLPTRALSFEQERVGGPVESKPKLVEHISGRDQPGLPNSYPHASLELL